jgi:hypothetical protein
MESYIIFVAFILLLFVLVVYAAIAGDNKRQKEINENTISTYNREQARELIAEFLNVKPSQVVFTSGVNDEFAGFRVMKYGSQV